MCVFYVGLCLLWSSFCGACMCFYFYIEITIGYLMHKRGIGCLKAMALVKACRPQIRPNPAFVDMLKSLERCSSSSARTGTGAGGGNNAKAEARECVRTERASSIDTNSSDDVRGKVVRACILAIALRLSASMLL